MGRIRLPWKKERRNVMSNIGKLTTFCRLLNDESVIMIPKVQRDYAYGRQEKKVEEVLDGMLDTMLAAVKNNATEIFDFIYGGSYIRNNNKSIGLIPLDGQQRLTTLFLLHFYASILQKDVQGSDVECLKKFRYETRQSATDFCESLIGGIRTDILSSNADESKCISEIIKDNPKYLPSYESDPTIQSMLNVLNKIEGKCKEYSIHDLWTKLVMRDNIQFYSLSLDDFGLTDDLYIKMNSRGKKLTEFEIFKSDLEKAVAAIDQDIKESMSRMIDNEWMDMLWDYANSNNDNQQVVQRADSGFMCLFRNVFRLELFRRRIEDRKNRDPKIAEIITDKEAVESIISIFNSISSIHKRCGIEEDWYKYFYFSQEDVIGEDNRIRLFWQLKQNHKSVFLLATERELSVPEFVYFYALHLIEKNHINEQIALKRLRIIRNLVTANVRSNVARYEQLAGFLNDAEMIITNEIIPNTNNTFISTACDEERLKLKCFQEEDYQHLLRYENHQILQGSVMLFIDKYMSLEDSENSELFRQLHKFEYIFSNEYKEKFSLIRIGLIDADIEYMQYHPSMANEDNMTRRYFLHRNDELSHFFIKNELRRNQEAILDILSLKFISLGNLKDPFRKCLEFKITNWQYYLTKYPVESNREDTKYGCYVWDDKEKRPLEMVILNSSYHSESNIEWKVLNHILISKLWNPNKYSLDFHASSPFVMIQLGVTLTITQEGWLVDFGNTDLVNALRSSEVYKITDFSSETSATKYLVDFFTIDESYDYIDLGIMLVNDIENVYAQFETQ